MNRLPVFFGRTIIALLSVVFADVYSQADVEQITETSAKFSDDFVKGNYSGMHNAYWDDAIILPPGRDIMKGKDAIKSYWTFGPNFSQLYHRSVSDSIIVTGNFAFDYGYWYSEAKRGDKSGPLYSGKYIIVWEKRDGTWKMLQDIWNNRSSDWIPERPK